MRESDALARLVLLARATEQIEDALMILGGDPPAIVGDRERRPPAFRTAAYLDLAGASRVEIFDGILDDVRDDLLDREPVAGDGGQARRNHDLDAEFVD